MTWWNRWRTWARGLDREIRALYLALGDARTPWYAKALAAAVVAYALSPIDLIPDPIPIVGYLDDLLIVPLGILVVRRLIPPIVFADCRAPSSAPKSASGEPEVAGRSHHRRDLDVAACVARLSCHTI